MGLIAVAKLLSPSHNQESISLHSDYCSYLRRMSEEKGEVTKNEFKGFISNRFGRIGELSHLVIDHLQHIRDFFEEYVDENSNKLVLAVHTYVESDWFLTCCEIADQFYKDITIPIKQLIGMDEFKGTKNNNRD